MKESADLVSKLLRELADMAKVGNNLLDLESYAEHFLKKHNATSVNKGYKPHWAKDPFPNILCLSVNNEITHGIPRDYKLNDGDLLKIDVGIKYKGHCADSALTVPVGEISSRDERLIRYAKRAIYIGIDKMKAGAKISEVGIAIQLYLRQNGFVPNQVLCGHAIGKEMHESPQIPMFDTTTRLKKGKKIPVFKAGQVYCIEPHVSYRDWAGALSNDGWTIVTRDGRNSVMFEHMVLVLEDGYKILTNHFILD
jgi:methionyl aminopeptidase